ncbi:putative 60S ribosomal protein L18-1 [Acorus calamus]|uniref:60S ribosomal protein L18-1 n=1 Tax=Acorus calamus TaxID=4465 RepID=A0AAV9DNM7_ACOCL|nr:putative 60S ribosomal protein L18-1 [Acorus calamus]
MTMTLTRTILLLAILITITDRTVSDPQTNLLNIGCSQYNASNPADLISKLNQTFSDLRSQINNASTSFATAQQPRGIDLVALNSDDIYLKLLVKVPREEDWEQFNAVILKRLFMSKTNNGRNFEFGPKRSPNQGIATTSISSSSSRAEAPKLVSLLEEMKNGLNFLTQEPRFLREEETMLVPPWLEPLLSLTFFTICRVHGDSMRSECNMEFSSDIGSMFGNMNNSPGMSSADPFVRILNK